MILRKEFSFEAAHYIKNHPGKCRNLHGHSYRLFVSVAGEPAPDTGMIIDFNHLAKTVQEHVIQRLDHTVLNELVPVGTSESVVQWVWDQLAPTLPCLFQLELFENASSCVIYRGNPSH